MAIITKFYSFAPKGCLVCGKTSRKYFVHLKCLWKYYGMVDKISFDDLGNANFKIPEKQSKIKTKLTEPPAQRG